MRFGFWIMLLPLFVSFGCTPTTVVMVRDAKTGAPISDAAIVRSYVQKPYFIVGTIVNETKKTNQYGAALFLDPSGGFIVQHEDYQPSQRFDAKIGWTWIELEPNEEGAKTTLEFPEGFYRTPIWKWPQKNVVNAEAEASFSEDDD